MSPTTAVLDLWADSWGAALGRACWQGGLAIGLVWLLCRFLPRLPGRFQCWLWRLAYLKLLVAFLWAVPFDLPVLNPVPAKPASIADVMELRSESTIAVPGAVAELRNQLAPIFWLLSLWLAGAGCCGAQLFTSWRRSRRLRAAAIPTRDEALFAEHKALCRRLGIQPEPALLTAEDLACPVLVGVGDPAVLLPASYQRQFDSVQLRLMVAHELTHLKRHDLAWAWLPNIGRVLFFFHPLVWLAEREWRLAQEMACDEQVVLLTGASASRYGSLLLEIIGEAQHESRGGLLTVGVAGGYSAVKRRLDAIRRLRPVSAPGRRPGRAARVITAVVVITGAVSSIIPWRLTARPVPAERLAALTGSQSPRDEEGLRPGRAAVSRGNGPNRGGTKKDVLIGKIGTVVRISETVSDPRVGGPAETAQARHSGPVGPPSRSSQLQAEMPDHPASAGTDPAVMRHTAASAIRTPDGPGGSRPERRLLTAARPANERMDAPAGTSILRSDPSAAGENGNPTAAPAATATVVQSAPADDVRPGESDPPFESSRSPQKVAMFKPDKSLGVLHLPKPFVVPAAFMGWHHYSPLSGKSSTLRLGVERRDLKKMLIAMSEGQPVDLRALKEALAGARPGEVGDGRVLKNLLSQIARKPVSDSSFSAENSIFMASKGAPLFNEQVAEKRRRAREAVMAPEKRPAADIDKHDSQGVEPNENF